MQALEKHVVDQGIQLDRQHEESNALLVALQNCVGFLEDQFADHKREHTCNIPRVTTSPAVPQAGTPYPDIIDLTSDKPSSGPSSVIDLTEDSDDKEAVLVGGSLNHDLVNEWLDDCHSERLGSVVPETPPPQEVMEQLRETPNRDKDNLEASRAVDLLV